MPTANLGHCSGYSRQHGQTGEWNLHPLDAESYPDKSVKRTQYGGSAGVILDMQLLHGWGYAQEPLKWQPQVLIQAYLNQPDVSVEPGLQLGLSGILISAMQLGQNTEYYQSELLRNMQNTMALPYFDITSGQTGVMHLALFLFRKNGQKIWADIFRQGVDCLLENWRYLPQYRQWLWQSEVFGMSRHYYGARHGLAGNVGMMLRGHELLTELKCEMIWSRARDTLHRSKKSQGEYYNWPISVGDDNLKMLV